jgi:hypothetical protein
MKSITTYAALLATIALGLSAGALLAEGAVLVPFWRSLQPESFLAWYRENAALLLRFFGPLGPSLHSWRSSPQCWPGLLIGEELIC